MSGGVDSSVSAALLKEQGYDVTGVFIKVWQPDFMPCSWKDERRDAMRVAAHLDIPFITLDLEKEYKKEVVDYMIEEYKVGRTPNPDVMCNKYVKFGRFFDFAMSEGADYIATGHYARTSPQSPPKKRNESKILPSFFKEGAGDGELLKGRDDNKDQSYFLWTLTSKQLSKTLFPVGTIEKPKVRKFAKKFNLPNAEKKDSQGLCFVGKVEMKEFLKHFINEKAGYVLNLNGEVIGHHEGSLFYTIGERHGFVITKKTPTDQPYFVVSKNNEKNTLTVDFFPSLVKEGTEGCYVHLSNTNWISLPTPSKTYQARVRYRGKLHNVTISFESNNQAIVIFTHSTDTIASGQSLVVYDGEVCVGGGIIEDNFGKNIAQVQKHMRLIK